MSILTVRIQQQKSGCFLLFDNEQKQNHSCQHVFFRVGTEAPRKFAVLQSEFTNLGSMFISSSKKKDN